MTLEDEFLGFIKAVYPDPPLPQSAQWKQLRDAFYGGALVYARHPRGTFELDLQYKLAELKAGV